MRRRRRGRESGRTAARPRTPWPKAAAAGPHRAKRTREGEPPGEGTSGENSGDDVAAGHGRTDETTATRVGQRRRGENGETGPWTEGPESYGQPKGNAERHAGPFRSIRRPRPRKTGHAEAEHPRTRHAKTRPLR